jgi:BirA family transcriptional regulator, biotin operon repressor / biotin---[acetyl-CoA-carboxylase] ligase
MKEVDSTGSAPKPLTFELLRQLSDGEFHSGEVLAQKLGVSRASVNNALQGIEQFGLTLYSVRGRGYCLTNPPQWLSIAEIKACLAEQAEIFSIEILDEAVSTNTVLLKRAAAGEKSGSVIAVEWQSGGRGRLGRTWHSGLGNALTFSLLRRFDCGLAGLSGLSLATGIALIRAFHQLGISGAQLKWPNDIMTGHGKIAGILIEAQGDMLGPSAVVIGIGINLSLPQIILHRIDQPVSDLSRLTESLPSRNQLLATVLCKLAGVLREFSAHGFAALRDEWESAHFYQNKPVQLLLPDGKIIQGVVRGVNQNGALLVEVASATGAETEIRAYHTGEISIRRQDDSVAV